MRGGGFISTNDLWEISCPSDRIELKGGDVNAARPLVSQDMILAIASRSS